QPEKSETPNTGSGVSPADATQDSAETQAAEKIITLTEFATTTFRAPSLPCFLLRPHSENPDFFGRKETLDSIEDVLQPPEFRSPHMGSQSLRSITLCGFGGVGKTQIALQYAFNSIRNNTYDAVFWVQADGKEKIANSFKEVALQLKLVEATEATDPVVTRNIVLEWLSRPYRGSLSDIDIDSPAQEQSFAKWLMIFDNADTPELLRDLWPVSGHGSALVTSRDPYVGTYLHSTKNIVLQPFNTDEASRLLCKLAFISDATPEEQAASIELSEKVGGYPLALVLISSSMRRNRVTFMEALESYDKETPRSELYNAQVASPYDRYSKTLSSVWVFKESGNYGNLLLEILSLLDPDAISETILRGKGRPVQSTETALRQLQHEYLEARKEIVKSSLVRQDSKGKQLIIHRVVQEHIRKRMSPERRSMVYTYAVRLLLEAWIHDPEEKFTHLKALWDTAKIVSPHAYRLMELYQSEQWELKLPADIECGLARLLQKSGWYLFEIGYCESSFPLLECALKLCEKHATNLEVKTLLADILFSLSSFSAEKNQPQDALQYASRHLDIRMQVEKEKPHLGRHAGLAYTEMALGLLLNGEYEAAIRYSRDGKAILIKLEAFKAGKYWPDFAVIHEAISLIALGRGSEAIPMLKDSIAFRENKYGPNDTESFKFGFHTQLLANVYSQQGNWKEAAELYQRSLSNYRATVGDHYHRTSQVCVKLAEYHAREFQVETAK
ncbi:P-loop containing nucleoside triphosphate hydrolase protein, partial [Bisporella sp. PMI_857]